MTTTTTPAKAPAKAAKAEKTEALFPGMPNVAEFGLAKFEMPDMVREMADKGVQQAKTTYDKFKSMAEEATDMLEDNFEQASKNATTFGQKAISAARDNVNAGFEYAEKLLGAKTYAEAIEIQTEFARKQFDMAAGQAKEFQSMVSKAAEEASKPVKDGFAKAMQQWKQAF